MSTQDVDHFNLCGILNNMNNHHVVLVSLIKRLYDYYKDRHIAEQYAWWTLESITGQTRSQLLAGPLFCLSREQELVLEQWVAAMTVEHKPIQYLIGHVPFCALTIIVKPPVLIPRPETENWCAELIAQLVKRVADEPLSILDLCSGTGCIGLACAQALPKAHVVCVDNAAHALELGRYNAEKNSINNVAFVDSNLFDQLQGMQFDLILTNPPYIGIHELDDLDLSVTVWEDKWALFAENQGYALIEKIIASAPDFIRYNPVLEKHGIAQLIIEHGATQSATLVDLMAIAGYIDIQVHKDLAGKERVVSGRRVHVADGKKPR